MTNSYKVKREIRRQHLVSIGLNPGHLEDWRNKWNNLCFSAKGRNAICSLSFEEYTQLAVDAGITQPEQIGRSVGQYQMGRCGDTGDYVIGNCRFVLQSQNIKERGINGGDAAISSKLTGRKATWLYRKFEVVSPDGESYVGENLKAFCEKHGLTATCMGLVCRGLKLKHKGWTGRYL